MTSSIVFLLTIVIFCCYASKKHEKAGAVWMRITFIVTRVVGVDIDISKTDQDCTVRPIAALNTPKTRLPFDSKFSQLWKFLRGMFSAKKFSGARCFVHTGADWFLQRQFPTTPRGVWCGEPSSAAGSPGQTR